MSLANDVAGAAKLRHAAGLAGDLHSEAAQISAAQVSDRHEGDVVVRRLHGQHAMPGEEIAQALRCG